MWLLSFALPAIYPGGRTDVPGIGALYFALMVGPVSSVYLSSGALSGLDAVRTAAYSLYFLVLAAQNVVVPLCFARGSRVRPRTAMRFAAAALATSVVLVPFADLYHLIQLADGDRVRLLIGYFVWTASFWLVAIAAFFDDRIAAHQPLNG